jgi:hypothetical protein
LASAVCSGIAAFGQTAPAAPPQQQPQPPARAYTADLGEYGVTFEPDARLIVMMAALDAAGFDPTSAGRQPSQLRQEIRKNYEGKLGEATRTRLRSFFERNKLPAPATPAQQAARYVSLALEMGTAPGLTPPERADDLPGEVLEVIDFAPLVRDFYQESGIGERLPAYLNLYRTEGNALRDSTAEMVTSVLSYLHTRPITTTVERTPVKGPEGEKKKKGGTQKFDVRVRERRFVVVPDLLAVPGSVNLRAIADAYYLIAPPTANMNSTEVRRAYLRYVAEQLTTRFSRDTAARRDALRILIDERAKENPDAASADINPVVTRSLVAAADARMNEIAALEFLTINTALRLRAAKEADRPAITRESAAQRQTVLDETAAQLAEAYEGGAVLAFYFAEQLRGIESSGFDVGNAFADMIASFDVEKEKNRPAEYKETRARALAARKERATLLAARAAEANSGGASAGAPLNPQLVAKLDDVEQLLRLKNYPDAETRLKAMMQEFPGEPRIFFALGRLFSLAANDTFDEKLQGERLNRALTFYRQTTLLATPDAAPGLLSRAHEATGRILAFLDQPDEALKEFDAAIKLGDVPGGAKREAEAGKQALTEAKPSN